MTIRPGQAWERPLDAPLTVGSLGTDAELAAAVATGQSGPFSVSGGDLYRAIGRPVGPSYGHVVAVDAVAVRLDDGAERIAVAHVVARRPGGTGWWRGRIVAVCNVDYVGEWNVAPRAHPNDGRIDVVDVAATMSLRARWQARRRLPLGTHVPHPDITTRSARQVAFEFNEPLTVWLDGTPVGAARTLTVSVRPDAFELLV